MTSSQRTHGSAHVNVVTVSAEKVEEPTLTRTPTDKEVREGQKVRFDAAAKGVPKPTIKW